MYQQFAKQELHLATQIHTPNELNQILKVGSVQQYCTEEEAKQGHQEIIRKLKNREFEFIPEVYSLVFKRNVIGC
jgi:hypothetical protein